MDIEKTNEQLFSITCSNVQADMNVKLNVIIFFMFKCGFACIIKTIIRVATSTCKMYFRKVFNLELIMLIGSYHIDMENINGK